MCLILGDVDLDRLVKVISGGLFHCEVSIFSFVINILGRHFETRYNILWLPISINCQFLNIPKGFLGWLGDSNDNKGSNLYIFIS